MRYIYGITECPQEADSGNIGIGGSEVLRVPFKNLCALVSEIPEDKGITLEDGRVHEKVVLEAMNEGTVIPVGFGLLVKSRAEVEDLLRRGYLVFQETVERLRGTIQADVRISWDTHILEEVLKDEEIRAVEGKLRRASDNLALKIELGRMVKESLSGKEQDLLPEILDRLKALSMGCIENRIKNHDMVLNASFLLQAGREKSFTKELAKLEKAYEGRLSFQCVIPLPVYNFVGMHVKKPNYQALDEARQMLGLDEEVTISEVNMAFNRLARLAHPDRNADAEAETKFTALKRARDTLIEYCENYPCIIARREVENTCIISRTGR